MKFSPLALFIQAPNKENKNIKDNPWAVGRAKPALKGKFSPLFLYWIYEIKAFYKWTIQWRKPYGCAQGPLSYNRIYIPDTLKPEKLCAHQTGIVLPSHILVLLTYMLLSIFTLLFLCLLQAHIPRDKMQLWDLF